MLKIKDNVNLEELEKFGFHKGHNSHLRNPLFISSGERPDNMSISSETRTITIDRNLWICGSDYYNFNGEDVLFDLIKADLVEKVGK